MMDDSKTKKIRIINHFEHHERQELCQTRPKYRNGRRQTAIKVFTIADESFYLLIHKVPALSGVNVGEDLRILCETFGTIEKFELVDYPQQQQQQKELFTNVYMVKYEKIIDAIRAKKRMDDYEFLGSLLHVCYAPEHETIADIRCKLNARKRYVGIKLAQCTNLLKKNK